MSTTADTGSTAEQNETPEELNEFDVHLIVPVRSVDPIDAVDTLLQEVIDFGMRSYIFRVRDRVTDASWYVGAEGILTDDQVDAIADQARQQLAADGDDA